MFLATQRPWVSGLPRLNSMGTLLFGCWAELELPVISVCPSHSYVPKEDPIGSTGHFSVRRESIGQGVPLSRL